MSLKELTILECAHAYLADGLSSLGAVKQQGCLANIYGIFLESVCYWGFDYDISI